MKFFTKGFFTLVNFFQEGPLKKFTKGPLLVNFFLRLL